MSRISKDEKEFRKSMDGTEILSLKYEGVVGVHGNKLIQNGKVIKVLKTRKDWNELSREAFYDEFGFYPESNAAKRMLEEEFGTGSIWDKTRKRKKLKKVI
jgi:hypothetical protein